MPAPSFSSFPTLAPPIKPETTDPERSRESSPSKRRKRHHDYERDEDSKSDRAHTAKEKARNGDEKAYREKGRRDGQDRDDKHRSRRDEGDRERDRGTERDRDRRHREDRDKGRSSRDKDKDKDKDHSRRSEIKHERKRDREIKQEEPVLPPDYTPTVPLPTRDEVAGFFADTVGSGRGVSQADWRGIPRYRRDTHYILGYPTEVRIDKYKDDSQPGIQLMWKRPMDRASQKTRLPQAVPDDQVRRVAGSTLTFESSAPFVPFTRSATRFEEADEEGEDRAADEFDVEFDAFPLAEQARLDRVKALEQAIVTRPDDVSVWLEYATAHLPGKAKHTPSSAAVTLAILDKALAAPANSASAPLHLAYLRTASEIWSGDQLAVRWGEVLKLFPTVKEGRLVQRSMEVWLEYLGWCEGAGLAVVVHNGKRGFDAVCGVYEKVIRDIRAALLATRSQDAEETLLYLFLRYALFVRHTGYHELGLALMQSLMEITFLRPHHLRAASTPFHQILGEFAVFWDSDASRFGEAGAKGWCNAVGASTAPAIDGSAPSTLEEWYAAETAADQAQQMPARLTIDVEQDPFRIIVFEDVLPVLFPITSDTVRLQAVYALLNYVGADISPPGTSTSTPHASDPSLQWKLASSSRARSRMWPAPSTEMLLPWRDTGAKTTDTFACPVKSWISETRTLLSTGDWFSDAFVDADMDLVRHSLDLLRPVMTDPRFTTICLAVEASLSVKNASALSKRILKTDSDNLLLWDAHARLERLRGRSEAARAVYAAALASAAQRDEVATLEEVDLWQAWVELEIGIGQGQDQAVILLHALRDAKRIGQMATGASPSFTPIDRLRCKQMYASMTATSTNAVYLKAAYLARVEDSVDAACDLFESHLSPIRMDAADEAARQAYARFLISLPVPPFARLVQLVKQSVLLYPNNTLFLSLLVHLKRQGRDILNLMTHLDQKGDASIVNGLWSTWAVASIGEAAFWRDGSAERERVRVLFGRIVSNEKTSRSASAWILYIEFEAAFSPNRAKSLSYRALNHVGANKALFMLPFGPLLPSFSKRELRDWVQVMLDRGIRLRVPVPYSADDPESDGDMDTSDDDVNDYA